MMTDRGAAPKQSVRMAGITAKLAGAFALASIVVLLVGVLGMYALRTARNEVKIPLQAEAGAAAFPDEVSLARIDRAETALVIGVLLGVLLLACIFLVLFRSVVKPLRTDVRLLDRLAVGDSGGDVPADQLARDDEIGELARAIRGLTAFQREEVDIANGMSAGDFSGVVSLRDPADAVGHAIRRMADVTIDTLRRVDAHAGQVMTDCETIASSGRGLSAKSEGISLATAEIGEGIDRVRAHAAGNAELAGQAGLLTNAGSQSVDRGYEDIGEMGVVMLNMQACGDKIVRIAKSISDIAFQTNLLALNASVEAARAGRHGKGFTIVAGEVRNLAGRTSQAADETSTLMKETVEQVELAAGIAGRINAIFAEMQDNIQEADRLLSKIVAASGEQSDDIERISAALRRADRSARENMEHVGGILEKAERLAGRTGQLRRVIGRLNFNPGFERAPDYEPLAEPVAALPEVRLPQTIRRDDWEL